MQTKIKAFLVALFVFYCSQTFHLSSESIEFEKLLLAAKYMSYVYILLLLVAFINYQEIYIYKQFLGDAKLSSSLSKSDSWYCCHLSSLAIHSKYRRMKTRRKSMFTVIVKQLENYCSVVLVEASKRNQVQSVSLSVHRTWLIFHLL